MKKFIFYTVLFLFIFAIGFGFSLADWDLFARLIVGKTFFQTGGLILQNDFLSYTPTHRWLDHEWGSSVVFYFFQHHFGDMGLYALKAALIFGIFVFIIKTIELRGLKSTTAYNILFFFFAFHAMAEIIQATIRCQLFTFFFFALWLYVLERIRLKGEWRLLWILPATTVIWSNLHGGCFAGLGLLALYAIGEFLNKKPFKKYIFAGAASFLALFINPYGAQYVWFLFSATTMQRPLISEWQGSFSSTYLLSYIKFKFFFFGAILTAGITWLKTRKIKDWTKVIVLVVMSILAIKHVRHQPFFVICASAFLYDDFYNLIFKIGNKKIQIAKEALVYGVLVLASISLLGKFDKLVSLHYSKYPILETEFIKINNLKGNVFTGFHYGSYVAYKLYPNNLISMDGRYEEVYFPDMLRLMGQFHLVDGQWDEILKRYHTDILLVDKKYEDMIKQLVQNSNWEAVFNGPNYAVFVPKGKNYKNLKLPNTSQKYYDKKNFETDLNWL